MLDDGCAVGDLLEFQEISITGAVGNYDRTIGYSDTTAGDLI